MSTTSQKEYDFTFDLNQRRYIINDAMTIGELDETVIALNHSLARTREKEQKLRDVQERIYQFMRQHHAFDLYIEESQRAWLEQHPIGTNGRKGK